MEDTTPKALLSAMESNMIAFWSVYGQGTGCSMEATPHVFWFYTGIHTPIFNGVISIKQEDEVLKTIHALQARINHHGAPALWWIGPLSKPQNIDTLLEEYGLTPAGEVPGMAINLLEIEEQFEMIQNLAIRKVQNTEMQALWAQIAGAGTGFSDNAIEALIKLEAGFSDFRYNAQYRYIGFLDEVPVATSALVLESNVAGIYAVATLPEARKRGIGRAMTVISLHEARQLGYQVGILQASAMGFPVYSQIGFREVCKYRLYLQSKNV